MVTYNLEIRNKYVIERSGKGLVSMVKPYSLFILSTIILGLGICLVTMADLGTTAITSPPYVMSQFVPISFGMLVMLMNTLYVFIQLILLSSKFPKTQYLQLLVGPVLGVAIDSWSYIISFIPQPFYSVQLFMVVLGCVVIALSIVLQLKANVVNNPAEGIVKVIAIKTNQPFSTIKLMFDVVLVIIALIISTTALGMIYGVREGTIISTILVGALVKVIQNLTNVERFSPEPVKLEK